MRRLVTTLAVLVCSFGTAGCSYNAVQHDGSDLLPDSYGDLVEPSVARFVTEPELAWWQSFELPELNALLTELNEGNYDLEIGRQRVLRARALLGQQRSSNWPTLDAAAAGTRTVAERRPAPGQSRTSREDRLAFNAAYEVDLWGRRSAANHAAALSLSAEHASFRSVALTVQAQLAQQYFDLLSLQDRLVAVQRNVAATEDLLRLVRLRLDAGRASGVELEQQQMILLDRRSQLLVLERDRALVERAIAVLLGRDQLLTVEATAHLEDAAIPVVSTVQPAALLESRPDIVIAEADLLISDAEVYQTRTKRWPTLQLSADATLVDMTIRSSLWTTSLIGQLTAPLFNGKRITNEIKAAEADASIALQTYRLTVIQAIREVLDTLTDLNHQRDLYAVRQAELASSERLYDLTRQRFDAGNIDFLNLLEAQRSQFEATERALRAKRDYLTAIVSAYRAMGVPPDLGAPSEQTALARME